MDSSLYQVEELVDGMVTESGAVTDQAMENQANIMTNSHSNFHVKQELQSENEAHHPAPLNVCPVSPKTEHLFKTEQNRNLPIIESVVSLHQPPVVEQHQNGGLSEPKGLPTPCPQLIAHPDTDMKVVDDSLENIEKRCSTFDPVSVKKEMEHDEYYTHDIVPQPENMENQTSDIITSVQLEENVGRVLDSKGRNGKMEGKKEESQKGKITSDEREVVIWNRQNTSTEVAELADHGLPTPCPQLIAHHDTDREVIDGRLENIEKQNVTNTSNNINHISIKEEPESDDGYTHDLPSRPVNTFEGNMENERSDIITSVKLEENHETVIESGGRSGKMEEKQKESEEVEMSVEEEEDVCQQQENSLSNIADKKERADNSVGSRQSDSKRTSTERSQGQKRDKQGKFRCDVCSYATNKKSDLTKHKRIHTNEKPFTCDICGFSANDKSNLNAHNRIHTQGKVFVCEVCGHSTNWKNHLIEHMHIHTQEKVFVCDVCGYSTNWKSNINKHIRIHSGARPYKCNTCNMKFSDRTALRSHNTTHHNKNPHIFKCQLCEYTSKDKQTTKRHEIRIHTKQYPHECHVCKMGFIMPGRLQTHMISKHKQK